MITSLSAFTWRYSKTLLLIWFLTIFALCAMPGEYIPTNNWLDLLSADKLVHASIFFVLCVLGFLSLYKISAKHYAYWALAIAAIVYGGSLEYMQGHFFRHRSADWHDIIANSTGCFLALLFRQNIIRYVEGKRLS